MVTINIYEAKAKLSKLVERAAAGEEVIIARGGRPAARLTQLTPARRQIRFGVMRGRVTTAADFDGPLSGGDQAPFEGR